jgi:uncharacterized SAM-binding protein YcdF (DUF218 family)
MPPVLSEIAVVLGARVLEGGVPSGSLRARVECAVGLYRAGRVKRLLLSGGVLRHAPSEAEVMARLARELGIPQEALILEQESRRTAENARLSARILESLGVRRVLLVSDDFHLFRACRCFWAEGIDAMPVAAPRDDRELAWPKWAYWTLREALAVARRPGLLLVHRPGRS